MPRPRNGHWSKCRAGNVPEAPPLPEVEDERLRTVVISPSGFARPTDAEGEARALHTIAVPDKLTKPHPLVKATASALRRQKPTGHPRLSGLSRDGALDVRVSRQATDRALRILDTVIKAAEEHGWTVEVRERPPDEGTVLLIENERIPVRLEEAIRRKERPPTAKEKRDADEIPQLYGGPWYEYVPTGKLALSFSLWLRDGIRRRWCDGRHQRIEDLLPKLMDALVRYAALAREHRRQREERERRHAEEQRLREERAERIRREQADLDELLGAAGSWHKAEQLRAYVAYVQRRVRDARGDDVEESFHEWVRWALNHADRLDPMVAHDPTVLDE